MSAWVKNYGGLVITILAMAVGAALFTARSVASERVVPVELEVSVLKAEVAQQKVQNERIETKLDRLIEMHITRSPQ